MHINTCKMTHIMTRHMLVLICHVSYSPDSCYFLLSLLTSLLIDFGTRFKQDPTAHWMRHPKGLKVNGLIYRYADTISSNE